MDLRKRAFETWIAFMWLRVGTHMWRALVNTVMTLPDPYVAGNVVNI
jgi:hypothetical protein